MKTLADYWPQYRRDTEQLATPLFPAATPGRQGHCTAPDALRYEPVGTDDEALSRIADQAHVIDADGHLWLLVELTPPLHDFLLTRGADAVDDEDGGDAEPGG